jgi:hypothetical protein
VSYSKDGRVTLPDFLRADCLAPEELTELHRHLHHVNDRTLFQQEVAHEGQECRFDFPEKNLERLIYSAYISSVKKTYLGEWSPVIG